MQLNRIIFIILISCSANAMAYDEALKMAALAAFKQSGGEDVANRLVKENIPKKIKEKAEQIVPLIVTATSGRLELKWTF